MRFFGVCLLAMLAASTGCMRNHIRNNLPPSQMIMEPGPGVGGPGPGVMMYQPAPPLINATSQIAFVGPDGMKVAWDVGAVGMFDSDPVICPARYNFPQGAIYRLKLCEIPGRPGIELYPTLEVGPALPRTEAFLAHNAIPVQFTEEDLDQVLTGNFVTKVIYLPDPEFQELALAGVETLVSTRLDPGVDPIVEADRRGAILAIVRLGNKDLGVPGGGGEGQIMATSYNQPAPGQVGPMGPIQMGGAVPPSHLAGVTMPPYGMPISGTPIGLPGPPHVPLGAPAGLQKHSIVNHTRVHVPQPEPRMRVDVKQRPGMSYPKPVNHVRIVENTRKGAGVFAPPGYSKREVIAGPGDPCPEGTPCPVSTGAEPQ